MLNHQGVQTRLTDLQQYLNELEPMRTVGLAEYETNLWQRRGIERTLELIIECAIDINGLLIVGSGGRPPRDYRTSFLELGRLGIVAGDLSLALEPMAHLRNLLAHEYEAVADRDVHAQIVPVLDLFGRYLEEVNEYLSRSLAEGQGGDAAEEPTR
jgi:uncharacterized protein YutE (UPF0331/DUF86 family)